MAFCTGSLLSALPTGCSRTAQPRSAVPAAAPRMRTFTGMHAHSLGLQSAGARLLCAAVAAPPLRSLRNRRGRSACPFLAKAESPGCCGCQRSRRASKLTPRLAVSAEAEGAAAFGVENGCVWTMMRHGRKVPHLGRPADQRKARRMQLAYPSLRYRLAGFLACHRAKLPMIAQPGACAYRPAVKLC